MAQKKATYKVYNGSSFDEIMFKTLATQVVDDATHRFCTDTEKTTWNGKINKTDYEVGTGGKLKEISGWDVRTINTSGKYKGTNCINAPKSNAWFYYDIEVHDATFKKITAKHFYSDEVYEATCDSGVWSVWRKKFNTFTKGTDSFDFELEDGIKIYSEWFTIQPNTERKIMHTSGKFKQWTACPNITQIVPNGDYSNYHHDGQVAVTIWDKNQFTLANYSQEVARVNVFVIGV